MASTHKGYFGNKIVFFGGKGGVGKTTCSAAFALRCAKDGLKTLIVSTDPAHSTSDIFGVKIGDEIANIRPNLDALEISGEKESRDYMEGVRQSLRHIVSPLIVDQINKQIDAASISPGTEEAALFDKMVEIITDKATDYDKVIFDTAPTGHTVRLLTLPDLLCAWLETLMKKRSKAVSLMSMANHNGNADRQDIDKDEVIGILKRRYEKILRAKAIMKDERLLSFVFVINAEKLPIDETAKAIKILESFDIPIDGIIVNKLLPEGPADAFWTGRKRQEGEYLRLIEETFKGKRIFRMPLLGEDMGPESLNIIADSFSDFRQRS